VPLTSGRYLQVGVASRVRWMNSFAQMCPGLDARRARAPHEHNGLGRQCVQGLNALGVPLVSSRIVRAALRGVLV
jgi:hypothetical protein